MTAKNKLTLSSFLLALSALIGPGASAASISLVSGLTASNPDCLGKGNCSVCDFVQLFISASDLILALSGTLAIVMFIIGGVIMITAYGAPDRINWGKNTMIATVIGLMIVLLAWTLVNLLILTIYGGDAGVGAFNTFTGKSGWSGPCNLSATK